MVINRLQNQINLGQYLSTRDEAKEHPPIHIVVEINVLTYNLNHEVTK